MVNLFLRYAISSFAKRVWPTIYNTTKTTLAYKRYLALRLYSGRATKHETRTRGSGLRHGRASCYESSTDMDLIAMILPLPI